MMARLARLLAPRSMPADRKSGPASHLLVLDALGAPRGVPRGYGVLAREGYMRNAIAHRAVTLVAQAAAGMRWTVRVGAREVPDHPVARLLARPHARTDHARFVEALVGHLMIGGNAFVEAVMVDRRPRELHVLRPDRVSVVPGPDGWPAAYDHRVGGAIVRRPATGDPIAPVLHLAGFHPLDDHYGFAPLEAAAAAVDLHNGALAWNRALLENAARPSGALVWRGPDGTSLSEDQYERLKRELADSYQGAANAGRPMLLEGGLDWKPLSLSPRDLDVIEMRHAAAREIAFALGVPPVLLGIPGDATYANLQEAQRALWRLTVLPMVERIATALAAWLSPAYGEVIRFEPDTDAVDALGHDRQVLWSRLQAVDFIDDDEKREIAGFPPRLPRSGGGA